jgi:hypothetical protein
MGKNTTIALSEENRDKLAAMCGDDETYDDVLTRLLA